MTQPSISNTSINASRSQTYSLEKLIFARSVFIWIISLIEVPIMLLTLFALCFLIKSHRAASVFVIHLILSDLVQIVCLMVYATSHYKTGLLWDVYYYSVIVSLYLMACIAFERYLLVSHPIWYRTHQKSSLKSSCLLSLVIWFVPLIFADIKPPQLHFHDVPLNIACFIPYPIIILCFVGTWRGLSHAISLTPHKRRMILGTLFLVLLSYTLLYVPLSVLFIFHFFTDYKFRFTPPFIQIEYFILCLLCLIPLADCLLYLFMRSDVADLMPSLPCCCTSDTQQISVRYTSRTTQPSS